MYIYIYSDGLKLRMLPSLSDFLPPYLECLAKTLFLGVAWNASIIIIKHMVEKRVLGSKRNHQTTDCFMALAFKGSWELFWAFGRDVPVLLSTRYSFHKWGLMMINDG